MRIHVPEGRGIKTGTLSDSSLLVVQSCLFTFQELNLPIRQWWLVTLSISFSFGLGLCIIITIIEALSFGNSLVIAAGIDSQDAADVPALLSRNAELAKDVLPFIEEYLDSLSDLVLAILRMMASARDGIEDTAVFGMFDKDLLQVLDGLFGVKSVQVNIQLFGGVIETIGLQMLVAFFV